MSELKNKTIITVATTGAWPTKANNPNVPMTPEEISEDVYACWKAGAAVAHLHMRDDEGKGTMDKADDKARKYMAGRADLLGAVRLPQTAFKQNAGTEVVTDVLFLRKRQPGEAAGGETWLGRTEVKTPEGPTLVNEYFARHPEMVLGEHSLQGSMRRANEYTVLPRGTDIDVQFAEAVARLPENVYSPDVRSAADRLRSGTSIPSIARKVPCTSTTRGYSAVSTTARGWTSTLWPS